MNESEVGNINVTEVENESIAWPIFLSRDRKEYRFIRMDGNTLRVNHRINKLGEIHEFFYDMDVLKVDTSTLKSLGAWDNLSQDVKDKLVRVDEGDIEEAANRMEHARKYKRNKYPGVAHSVTCSNCGESKEMSPGLIVKGAEKIAKEKNIIYTAEDFCRDFKCSRCFPKRRGRAASTNLPPKVELKCKCGKSIIYPASVVAKTASKKGLTVEKYVTGYACRKCKPSTFGRVAGAKLQSKVELKCKCGNSVTYATCMVKKFAEKKNMTIEDFVSGYRCQTCAPN